MYVIIEKLTKKLTNLKNMQKQTYERVLFIKAGGKFMGVTWKKIEKNIYQCAENPKKYKVVLYYGRKGWLA